MAGSGDTDAYVEFFSQVYENDARIQQSAAKCKRKGK